MMDAGDPTKGVKFFSNPREGQTLGQTTLIPSFDAIPHYEWNRAMAADQGIFGFNSRDLRSRPFNLLRSRVSKIMEANGWRSLGVVSATPGAGKSFVASNLAAALSRTPEKQVYLFDFDLRKSSIAEIFGVVPEVGINQYLAGKIPDLAPVSMRLGDESLAIFPSKPTRNSSAELVGGKRMRDLVDSINGLPDNVIRIWDLPPVFANDDAAIITSYLDGYILVIDEGRTTKKQIRDSINLLSPAPLIGTVINRYVGGLAGDDYGYGYGHQQAYAEYYG